MFILLVSADQMMNENGYFKLGQVDSGAHTWAATKTKKAVKALAVPAFEGEIISEHKNGRNRSGLLIDELGRKRLHRIWKGQTFGDWGKLQGHGGWKQHPG